MLLKNLNRYLLVVIIFVIAFVLGPLVQLDFLHKLPGDLGDSRLNNYFLENIYKFISGESPSLWHFRFLYPFPYVLGFSDNLFGASPIYLIARFLTKEADTAFQWWFLCGYVLNFIACLITLKKLKLSTISATIGALIFTFSLPIIRKFDHVQLHYRFLVPLGMFMVIKFIDTRNLKYIFIGMFFLLWQFYCSIYIGFFLSLFMGIMLMLDVFKKSKRERCKFYYQEIKANFLNLSKNTKIKYVVGLLIWLACLLFLFFPYIRVQNIYGIKRSWGEVLSMLPTLKSYFLADISWFWPTQIFTRVGMRHEHQMFIGIIPWCLIFIGLFYRNKKFVIPYYFIMAIPWLILMILTFKYFYVWLLLSRLPLFNSIRAVTRIIVVFLFPAGYFAAVGSQKILSFRYGKKMLLLVIIPLLIAEFSAVNAPVSLKSAWRQRLAEVQNKLPNDLKSDSILVIKENNVNDYVTNLDAMWIALNLNVATMNGYSGASPRGHSPFVGENCESIYRNIMSYLRFVKTPNEVISEQYLQIAQRVVPIGFTNCNSAELMKYRYLITGGREEFTN